MTHGKKKTAGAAAARGVVPLRDDQLRHVSGAGIGTGAHLRLHDLDIGKSTDQASPFLFR